MKAARIQDGIVVELVELPGGVALKDAFHPDLGFVSATAAVALGWTYANGNFAAPEPEAPTIAEVRQAKMEAVRARIAAAIGQGAPVGSLHVALDDGSRADMTAMGTTALAAIGGAIPWPSSYAQGWISIENTRIPLVEPADGLALAAGVGGYYAAVVQHGRDLKDAVAAAVDQAALAAIDIEDGWPA